MESDFTTLHPIGFDDCPPGVSAAKYVRRPRGVHRGERWSAEVTARESMKLEADRREREEREAKRLEAARIGLKNELEVEQEITRLAFSSESDAVRASMLKLLADIKGISRAVPDSSAGEQDNLAALMRRAGPPPIPFDGDHDGGKPEAQPADPLDSPLVNPSEDTQ